MKVAFLGTGIMGSRMAKNLLQADYSLTVWNRTAEKAKALAAKGARQAASPAEAAREAEVLITMLAEPGVVEATALGPDGFLDALPKGALWIDSSTVNPSFSRRMAAEAKQRGVRFLDAPVAGTKGPAAQGQLLFLVGGDEADLQQARPLMDVMGRDVLYVGKHGMGASLKMVFNMLLGQAMLAFSEGLLLGEALGISREKLFEVLLGGALVPPFVSGKRSKIEAANYEADFPLQWMQKDLHLAALSAYEQDVAVPSVNMAKEVYMLAARQGFAGEDFSAIYQYLKEHRQRPETNSGPEKRKGLRAGDELRVKCARHEEWRVFELSVEVEGWGSLWNDQLKKDQ